MDETGAPGRTGDPRDPDDGFGPPPAARVPAGPDPGPDAGAGERADPGPDVGAGEPPDPHPDPDAVLDPARVTGGGRDRVVALVERVASLEARVAALHAEQLSVLSDLAVDRFVDEHDVDLVVELGARCRWTSYTADRRLGTAMRLAACFPLLLADLAGGELDLHRVQVVVAEAELLDEEQALVLDALVAGSLAGLTTAQVKALVRAQIAVIDSDAVRERARRVLARRRVEFAALEDGAASLHVVGPAEAVRGVYDRLDALARDTTRPGGGTDPYAGLSTPEGVDAPDGALDATAALDAAAALVGAGAPGGAGGRGGDDGAGRGGRDRRGIDAKRFDACVELLRAPVAGAPGVATGTGPHLHLALSSAIGWDDLPAHLSGYGPVPAERVRRLLTHTGFRRVVTDPLTGHVVTVDGHTFPAGTLPDVSGLDPDRPDLARSAPRGSAPDDGASRPELLSASPPVVTAPGGRTGTRVPGATGRSASAATHDPATHGLVTHEPVTAALVTGDSVTHELAAAALVTGDSATHDSATGDPATAPRAGGDAPPWVPAEVEARDPGPGWNADENGYDPGFDHAIDDPADADPAEGLRDSEFIVTLDIAGLRPATLVGPQLVGDLDLWAAAARARARASLRGCPVAVTGDRTYRFSAALRRHLILRSPHCTAPGCRAPAHRCDLDHTTDHALGGPTCPCNTAPLCRRHHRTKHARGWTPTRTTDDPGDPTTTWLSPLGYLYTVPAAPLLPTTAATAALVGAHLRRRRRAAAALEAVIAARPSIAGIHAAYAAAKAEADTKTKTETEAQAEAQAQAQAGTGAGGGGRAGGGAGAPASAPTPVPVPGGGAAGGGHRVHTTDHVWEDGCRECEPDQLISLRRPRDPSPGRTGTADSRGGVSAGDRAAGDRAAGDRAAGSGATGRAPSDPGDPPF